MYGRTPERHFVRQTRSAIFWGILVPLAALGPGLADPGTELHTDGRLFALVPSNLSLLRGPSEAGHRPDARLFAGWIVLAKFPHALGLIRYWLGRLSGQRSPVIEYRGSVPSGGSVAG